MKKIKTKTSLNTPKDTKENVEIFPHSLVGGLNHFKPIFLMSDKKERNYLPVWVDFQESLSLSHYFEGDRESYHPYQIHLKILQEIGWQIKSILFYKMDGYRLYAQMQIEKDGDIKTFQERAEDVILFALYSKAQIFCKKKLFESAREIQEFKSLPDIKMSIDDYKSTQKYLI